MKQQLLLLCGIPFSGKSTLANQLVQKLGVVRVDLDEIKFELFGTKISDDQINQDGWDSIYQEMYVRIESLLKTGVSVVHDTGNFTVYERGLVQHIATTLSLPFVTVFVDVPVEVARKRMEQNRISKQRFDITDAAFQEAVDEMEPPTEIENQIIFSSDDDVETWLKNNLGV